MRDLAPEFAAAAKARTVAPSLMVYLDFEGEPMRAWTGVGPLEYGGHTWSGLGEFASVDALDEYSEIRAGSVGMQLTGVPNHLLSELRNLVYKHRAAEIYLALFDSSSEPMELIGVELLLRGTMDVFTISRSPSGSTLKISVANELSRLKSSWGLLYTDAHQQAAFPGDTGLRFVASMQDLDIRI